MIAGITMMIAGIISGLVQTVVVTLVILGMILVLLAIRFGSSYFLQQHRDDETNELRREMDLGREGISAHNVLYRFFFRGNE